MFPLITKGKLLLERDLILASTRRNPVITDCYYNKTAYSQQEKMENYAEIAKSSLGVLILHAAMVEVHDELSGNKSSNRISGLTETFKEIGLDMKDAREGINGIKKEIKKSLK